MNTEWHEQHVMPANATLDERVAWHREHAKHCACRPVPEGLEMLVATVRARKQTKRIRRAKPE
jgi:hypothetical protein